MARIASSALIDDIKGSVGGVTFSSWKGITIVRSKARSVRNPATKAQVTGRAALTFFTRRYYDDLTDDQRAGWDQYAQEVASAERSDQVQGGFGSRVVPRRQFQKSGHGWFVGINVRRVKYLEAGGYVVKIDDAPLGQTPPAQPEIESVVYDDVVGRFFVTWIAPEDFGHATTVRVGWWIKPNWGKARIQRNHFRDTEGQRLVSHRLSDLSIPRSILGEPLPDGVYAFQFEAVGTENGLVSPPSNIVIVKAKFVGGLGLFPKDFKEGDEWLG